MDSFSKPPYPRPPKNKPTNSKGNDFVAAAMINGIAVIPPAKRRHHCLPLEAESCGKTNPDKVYPFYLIK